MPSRRETRYAVSGDVSIAYQVVSEGPFDVVWVPGAVSNVELLWENEAAARFYSRVASFCRLVLFDKRGTGLSDRVSGIADLETRMDDVRAVMDAAGIERAAIVGVSEGGPMSVLFAATYPERTRALVVYGSGPRFTRAPGFPFGPTREESVTTNERDQRLWGTVELAREYLGADAPYDEVDRFASRMRQSASPGAVRQLDRMNLDIDVRGVLSSIRVPTLVLHRTEDHVPVEGARWMAERIPGARFVGLPGGPHMSWYGDWERIVEEIAGFLVPICSGADEASEPERVLATVLFTDIVGSTAKAAELGDRGWRELLERHHAVIRQLLARFRGSEIDTAGDGFFARVRRACSRDPVCGRDRRGGARAGDRRARGAALGRVRGRRQQGRGDRRQHRRARRRGGAARRGARLPDGEGPRRGLRDPLRGPRRRPS